MTKIPKSVRAYFAEIGAKGGRKSKRKLSAAQARALAKARWAKKPAQRAPSA